MRRFAWMLSLLLTSSVWADSPEPGLVLRVAPARVKFVAERAALQQYCGATPAIAACTVIRGATMQLECRRRSDSWRLTGIARFIPFLYLHQRSFLTHEQLHLADLQASIGELLESLAEDSFGSEEDCSAAARREETTFGSTMETFIAASTARRDRGARRRNSERR